MTASGRTLALLFVAALVAACAGRSAPPGGARVPEVLHVDADGTLRLGGRVLDPADVVIYPDGSGGERAAVRLLIPRHPDVFRDTITVRRERRDVPVERAAD